MHRATSALLAVSCLSLLLGTGHARADGVRPARPAPTASVRPAAAPSAALPAEDPAAEMPELPEKARKVLELPWQNGPIRGALGSMAQIEVPEGQMFLDGDATRRFLELNQNPTNGSELGLVAADNLDWVVTFEYSDIGHVKDDEKANLDAGELLKSLQEGNQQGNELRKKRGWDTVTLTGWALPPRYDEATHNLEWATKIQGDLTGNVTVNHSIRLLGRTGVMEALLLVSPEQYEGALPACKKMLGGYSYVPGQRYSEFRQGDRIAEIGLAGLITGGAIAAAAKSGILAKAGKGIVKLVVVAGAGIAALFAKVFGRKQAASE